MVYDPLIKNVSKIHGICMALHKKKNKYMDYCILKTKWR